MATTKPKGKAAAAPAAEVQEEVAFEVGGSIKFLGYGADVPEGEQILVADEVYEIVDVTEDGNPVVRIDNPEFNEKKKEDAEKNPRFVEVEALPNEVELVEAEEAEVAEAAAPVAAKTAPKGKAAAAAPAAKTAPKGKPAPAAKTAPKGKGAVAKPKEVVEVKDEDDLPELEGEDADVLALVNGSEDLIATAQELEANVAATEWQLGGILYHIRKDKLHREVTDEKGKKVKAYSENGGFAAFLLDFFNIDYRKAMHLIKIYVNFTQAQIENPSEVVATIGWTKASKIAPVMIEEGADANELVELATNNTVADLSEAIKEQVTVGGTKGEKGEKKSRITMKFRYFEEEAATVNGILETAMETLGLKDIGEALAHIVQEWATTNGGEAQAEAAPAQTKPVGRAAPKGKARAAA